MGRKRKTAKKDTTPSTTNIIPGYVATPKSTDKTKIKPTSIPDIAVSAKVKTRPVQTKRSTKTEVRVTYFIQHKLLFRKYVSGFYF